MNTYFNKTINAERLEICESVWYITYVTEPRIAWLCYY